MGSEMCIRDSDYVVDRFDPSGDELLDEYVASHPDVELEYARQTAVIPASVYSVRDGGCDFFAETKKTVCGAILAHYNAIGGRGSWLGMPLSDELTGLDGVGKRTEFVAGFIYWHPRTGAHAVTRDGMRQWGTLGWESGALGYPVSEPQDTGVPATQYQQFEGGDNYYNPLFGGAVWGDIKAKYDAMGGSHHPIGVPMTNEQGAGTGFRFNNFSNGTISWREVDRQTRFMFLASQRVWQALGREGGSLGFPVSDEVAEIPGVFHYVPFTGGMIAWNNVLGVRELTGQEYAYWHSVRNTAEDLGYPLPSTTPLEDSYEQDFTKGVILGMSQGIGVVKGTMETNRSFYSNDSVESDTPTRMSALPPLTSAVFVYIEPTMKAGGPALGNFIVRRGFYTRKEGKEIGWGAEKMKHKHNMKNHRMLRAVYKYNPEYRIGVTEPGNKKYKGRVDFLKCGGFSVDVVPSCEKAEKEQYITLIYRIRLNLTYKNAPSQMPGDAHEVGAVTAWCEDENKTGNGEPQRSQCPDYVNDFKKLGDLW